MTLQLAELLRMSLESVDVQEVPLSRELQFLECYLRIQQTRFSDRLTVAYRIDPLVLDAAVPHLLLHGIGPRLAPGRVEVTASKWNDRLHLEILDDGVGWPLESGVQPRAGVGLRNTRVRLRQMYASDFEFECANAPGGGCRVRISLPFCSAPAANRRYP